MKIPKKIKVGSYEYSIDMVKGRNELTEPKYLGKTKLEDLKIYIDSDLPQSKQEETFIHEVLHVCFDQAGIKRSEDEEEYLVNAFANQLYPILKDNNLLAK